MDDELKIDYTDVRDWTPVDRAGTVQRKKRVTFYIGKYGPFTEYFDAEGFDMSQVGLRVEHLRTQLRLLPR
jgi:hypothetical protein